MNINQATKAKKTSLTGYRWEYRDPAGTPVVAPGLPETVGRVLAGRGVTTTEDAGRFLDPPYSGSLFDPFTLSGMTEAVEEILAAVNAGRTIGIHGDYDADGLTATAVLADTLGQLGARPVLVVPDRYADGYGISDGTIAKVVEARVELLITVDCGISNRAEVAALRQAGTRVIVTDHHQPPPALPEAEAVINPKLPGETYPNRDLAGVGVAFKLAQAVLTKSGLPIHAQEAAEKWLLDLVAIGTVADLMPLVGENRTLVTYGLRVLRRSRRPGLQALAGVAGVTLAMATSRTIGYGLAPRINAAGRMLTPQTALTLLTTTDPAEAERAARQLAELNTNRRDLTLQVVEEVAVQLGEVGPEDRILIAAGPWKSGIVGLVAGRLVQRYHRPSVVIELACDEARGSGRSIPGFDIVAAIAAQQDLLTTFGGHPAAAGFSLPAARLDEFRAGLEAYAADHLTPAALIPTLMVDDRLADADLTPEFVRALDRLEPFGAGNPEPLFVIPGTVASRRTVGQDRSHLRLDLTMSTGGTLAAIGFGLGELAEQLEPGTRVELAGTPVISTFSGGEQVEWQVRDVRVD